MHSNIRFLLISFLIFTSQLVAKSKTGHLKTLLIKTSMGSIEVSLSQKSKQTSEAFIKLVESGAFNLEGNSFYRVVTPQNDTYIASDKLREKGIGVIQGGIEFVDPELKNKLLVKQTIDDFETTKESGLSHKPGAFALGRSFQDNSASLSEFFIDVEGHEGVRLDLRVRGCPPYIVIRPHAYCCGVREINTKNTKPRTQ